MSQYKYISFLLALSFSLLACLTSMQASTATSVSLPTAQLNLTPEPTVFEVNTPTPEPTRTETPVQSPVEQPRYNIKVILDYTGHKIKAAEEITYPNLSSDSLNELVLAVEPERLTEDFEITQLAWGNMASSNIEEIEEYILQDGVLQIQFDTPLAPGEEVSLLIVFSFTLPEQPGPFGYNDRGAVFSNWYPFVLPYRDGEGWTIHSPWAAGEHLVYPTADFVVEISVDNNELILAGPAIPKVSDHVYIYELKDAREFSWAVSQEYEVLTDVIEGIPVIVFVFPEHLDAGESVLETMTQAVSVFQSLFGPYPYHSLSLIEIVYGDGMEATGLFFMGDTLFERFDGTPENLLAILSVHETSHQWWYGLVGSDQALEPWLDEALATYCELLFYERVYPELDDWWWDFRVDRFMLLWDMSGAIYEYSDFTAYVNGVYLKGAKFFDTLRQEMGDEAFFNALRAYVDKGSNQLMTGEDMLSIFEEYSQVDLNPLIEEYFQNP